MLPMVFPDSTQLCLFCLAASALLVIPGPAVLYIVVQSAERGRRVGLASVAGIHLGTLVHVAAATVGLSALIVASAVRSASSSMPVPHISSTSGSGRCSSGTARVGSSVRPSRS